MMVVCVRIVPAYCRVHGPASLWVFTECSQRLQTVRRNTCSSTYYHDPHTIVSPHTHLVVPYVFVSPSL